MRYEEEFEDGHLPGAILLSLPEWREQAAERLDKRGNYISICLSGKPSAVEAYLLRKRGYKVVTMKDGMSGWEGETVC